MRAVVFTSIVLLAWLTCCTDGLNILGIFPYQGKSHFIVYRVLVRELARRGHNVTVVSHFPEKDPPKNYHDIHLTGVVQKTEDSFTPEKTTYLSLVQTNDYLSSTGRENCKLMLANKRVQDLVNEKVKFDLILVEQFNSDCALGVAYKLGAPVVALTSHVLMPWHYRRHGIPYNPSFVSFHFTEGGTKPTLYQRVERYILEKLFILYYKYVTQRSDETTLAKYFDGIPPLEELAREIKFLLISHHFTLTGSSLLPANVIEVGGYHVSKAEPLTGDIKQFVDGAIDGVIFVSFGSTVKVSTLAQNYLEALLGAMAKMPQRFIWRWDDISVIDKPPFSNLRSDLYAVLTDRSKLYISTWLPQVGILGHPKTVAFLSHAGMGGTAEAIHFGVPVVAMPLTGDQHANGAAVEESGLGVLMDFTEMTQENLLSAFKKVLDPEFRHQVKKLSEAWKDRPLSPLDTAVYWIEYAARNADFTFRSRAADVPMYQYLNLDIAGVFIVIFTIVAIIAKTLAKLCRAKKVVVHKKKKKN